MSEVPEDTAPVHEFTRDWWERLPAFYRNLDRKQYPPVPLLRYMDGPGRVAGHVRDINTAMWDGTLIDPETAQDDHLEWVAFLLGFGQHAAHHEPEDLRAILKTRNSTYGSTVGTRRNIEETAKIYLNPDARVQVLASSTYPHTLIIGVSADDVPNGNYQRVARQIRGAGVVPAGHALRVEDIRVTWDQWLNAAGDTWEEKEQNIITWNDSDYAGAEPI